MDTKRYSHSIRTSFQYGIDGKLSQLSMLKLFDILCLRDEHPLLCVSVCMHMYHRRYAIQ